MFLKRMSDIQASRDRVVTSPSDAAIGVATLSGLTLNRLEKRNDWSNHNTKP